MGQRSVEGFFRSLRSTVRARRRRQHRAQAEFVRMVAVSLERHVKLPGIGDVAALHPAPAWSRHEPKLRQPQRVGTRRVEVARVAQLRMLSGASNAMGCWLAGCCFSQAPLTRSPSLSARPPRDGPWPGQGPGRSLALGPAPMNWAISSRISPIHNGGATLKTRPTGSLRVSSCLQEEMTDHLPVTADWDALADLKVTLGRFDGSALLRRARTLGVMPEGAYVQALKTMSTRGWNRREPIRLPQAETPVMFARAVQLLNQSGTTVDQLTDEVGLPLALVNEIIGASRDPRPVVQI